MFKQFVMSVFALCCACGVATGQSWTQLNPTGTRPPGTEGHTVVYDSSNNRLVVFGGATATGTTNTIWVLSNANGLGGPTAWGQLLPTGPLPAPRIEQTAVYDPGSNRMIVFGGHEADGSQTNDVWVLTNANGLGGAPQWVQLSPVGGLPAVRHIHSAVYDAANNRMMIFGGVAGCFNAFNCTASNDSNDVWVLSNANGLGGTPQWTQLFPSGPVPPVRASHAAGYDPASNRMIIFGGGQPGVNLNDTWVLTSANGLGGASQWTQLFPVSDTSPRYNAPAGYNQQTNTFTVALGVSGPSANQMLSSDAWALSNANGLGTPTWGQRSPTSGPPPGRDSAQQGGAMDEVNSRLIVFGGSDAQGNLLNDVWVLAVTSDRPPAAVCQNVTVTAGPACTAIASIDAGGFDPDGDAITLTQSPPGPYPLGTTLVTLTATDPAGLSSSCTATVTIVDQTPPVINSIAASPNTLWPPNHKMVPVTVTARATDDCGATSCKIISVASNEPAGSDAVATGDAVITGSLTLNLRAERLGNVSGRIYTILIQRTDSSGNSATKSVTVSVPHDQGH